MKMYILSGCQRHFHPGGEVWVFVARGGGEGTKEELEISE